MQNLHFESYQHNNKYQKYHGRKSIKDQPSSMDDSHHLFKILRPLLAAMVVDPGSSQLDLAIALGHGYQIPASVYVVKLLDRECLRLAGLGLTLGFVLFI